MEMPHGGMRAHMLTIYKTNDVAEEEAAISYHLLKSSPSFFFS
jgi:hypothetical protein